MSDSDGKTEWQYGDEPINVILPRRDYERLRKILEREASMNWAMKWFTTVLVTLISGIIVITTFYDKFKIWLAAIAKASGGQ